jgi:hypothetical protein
MFSASLSTITTGIGRTALSASTPPEPGPSARPLETPRAAAIRRHDRLGGLIHQYAVAAKNHARSNKGTLQGFFRWLVA